MGIVISSRSWLFGSARLICAAAIVATAGNAAAGGREEDAAEPNPSAAAAFNVSAGSTAVDPSGAADPSVTVDLSVIDEQGAGPARRSLARPGGLLMPRPGVFPESQLHEPEPSQLPYATLTPPRQRAVNLRPPGSKRTSPTIRALALANPTPPPRPQEASPSSPSPSSPGTLTSIGREPQAVTAPSRLGAVVGPMPSLPQTLGPDDSGPARPTAQPPGAATGVASTAPDTVPAPAPAVSATPPVPPAAATASAPRPEPELMEASRVPAEPASTPEPQQTASTPPPESPRPEAEEQTVALQPASRGEQATLPTPGETLVIQELVQVEFDAAETDLSGSSRADLKDLADRLRSQENLRLQLLAYAEGEGLSPSQARRMSLSRALTVRSYLIENGIKTSRIDVRALGNKAPSAPMDRVDVKVVQR